MHACMTSGAKEGLTYARKKFTFAGTDKFTTFIPN